MNSQNKRGRSYIEVVSLYPTLLSKLYVLLRLMILPVKHIEKYFPDRGLCLDYGCGYGAYSLYIALKNPKVKVSGFDIDKKRMITANQLNAKPKNVSFCWNFDQLKRKKFDTILLIDLLHHIDYKLQEKLLLKFYKMLKKEGVLIIKDVDKKPLLKYCWNYIHDKIMTKDRLYFQDSELMANRLINLGFDIKTKNKLDIRLNPYPHYIISCVKK